MENAQVRKIIEEKNEQIEEWRTNGIIDSAAVHFTNDCIQFVPNQPAIVGIENFKAA